jgi:hypothetical protein
LTPPHGRPSLGLTKAKGKLKYRSWWGRLIQVRRAAIIPYEFDKIRMRTLVTLMGATLGGWLGWWLGASVGLMTGFILSMIGMGLGLYFAKRCVRDYLG